MATKRTILEHLTADELRGVVDQFDLKVEDRRSRGGMARVMGRALFKSWFVDSIVMPPVPVQTELGKSFRTTNEHIGNVYQEVQLEPAATSREFRIVQTWLNRRVPRACAW
jgi:hypothetical protein